MHPWNRPIGRRIAAAALVAVLLPPAVRVAAQPSSDSVCDLTTAERIVAVGDVHGAYDQFVSILRAAGLIDGRQRWIGGGAGPRPAPGAGRPGGGGGEAPRPWGGRGGREGGGGGGGGGGAGAPPRARAAKQELDEAAYRT